MASTTRRIATVFGGSGLIGRQVVPRLARQGYVVRIGVRDPERAAALRPMGTPGQIVPLFAPLTNAAAVARAVEGADVVVNLVGLLAEGRPGTFSAVMGKGAGTLAAAATAAGVARLVHVSAIGADASAPSAYARAKAEGEAAVRAAFPAATILRPSVVFGPEDHFFNRFATLACLLPVLPVIGGACKLQPVYVSDVADAVMAALSRPEAAGQTYELAGPRVASLRELEAWVLKLTGRRRRLCTLSAGLARLQARILEKVPGQPLTRDQLLLLERDNVATGTLPGLAELGVAATPMEAVVPDYLRRFAPPWKQRAA